MIRTNCSLNNHSQQDRGVFLFFEKNRKEVLPCMTNIINDLCFKISFSQ